MKEAIDYSIVQIKWTSIIIVYLQLKSIYNTVDECCIPPYASPAHIVTMPSHAGCVFSLTKQTYDNYLQFDKTTKIR